MSLTSAAPDTHPDTTAPLPPRIFLELILMIGLPAAAVLIGSSLVIVAYVDGFTEIPAAPAAIHSTLRN